MPRQTQLMRCGPFLISCLCFCDKTSNDLIPLSWIIHEKSTRDSIEKPLKFLSARLRGKSFFVEKVRKFKSSTLASQLWKSFIRECFDKLLWKRFSPAVARVQQSAAIFIEVREVCNFLGFFVTTFNNRRFRNHAST